jgi:hypothetical protein
MILTLPIEIIKREDASDHVMLEALFIQTIAGN